MQDKEILDEAEEALTCKTETSSTCSDSKDSTEEKKDVSDVQAKKEQQKDRSVFKKKKPTKKDRTDKNSPSRFFGDGVSFKGKLIGVETVSDARGDKMCQEAMAKLKVNVRSIGSHKRKITIALSIKGVKIRDEKTEELLYHHPVPKISYISQEISDARAFGYVFGSSDDSYQFIGIKTEKPAFHVVIALRDLFQTVLNLKKEIRDEEQRKASVVKLEKTEDEVQEVKDDIKEPEVNEKKENIYFDVILAPEIGGPFIAMEETTTDKDPVKTVDDLLGSSDELEKLQQGIDQMDTSIAEVTFNFEKTTPEKDPFDTSFVLGPKDAFRALPTPVPLTSSSPATVEVLQLQHSTNCTNTSTAALDQSSSGDKYAAFSTLDGGPSIFGNSAADASPFNSSEPGNGLDTSVQHVPDIQELEEQILKKSSTAPPKPPRRNRTPPPDLSVFADLDPLGKDRPYKDKTEFFQDVKNPPKKVLNDLVDKNSSNNGDESMSKVFDTHFGSPPSVFPAGFETLSHVSPTSVPSRFPTVSTSLPNAFPNHPKLSVPFLVNGNASNPHNPFENNDNTELPKTLMSTDVNNISYLGKTPPSSTFTVTSQQFPVSHSSESTDSVQSTVSSSPIPIPSRPQPMMLKKDRSLSTGSISSSLYSRSPVPLVSESPTHVDYFGHNISDMDGSYLVGMALKCDTVSQRNLSVEDGASSSTLGGSIVCCSDRSMVSPSTCNALSRPRPRPSSSKIMSVHSSGTQQSFQSFNVPSTENEVISKENMQSIANMLLTNGHRFRKNSLPTPSHKDCDVPTEKTIFTKQGDPFADDFFCSLPKKVNGHIAEIQDCI